MAKFLEWYPHSMDKSLRDWDVENIRILSIDPGKRNFGIRIESRNLKTHRMETLLMTDYDIMVKGKCTINEIILNLNIFLDTKLDLIKTCNIMIVERQMPINHQAVRISQHVISYLCLHVSNNILLPGIYEIMNKCKHKILDCPNGLKRLDLKKWSVEKATEIMYEWGDQNGLLEIGKYKKKDDIADTVCQAEALYRIEIEGKLG